LPTEVSSALRSTDRDHHDYHQGQSYKTILGLSYGLA
jgi:hypothetical protein